MSFRFTITTDLHQEGEITGVGNDDNFQAALDRIVDFHGDAGDFMISTGDLCESSPRITPQDFRDRIDETLDQSFRWITCVGNHDITESIPSADRGIQWVRNEWDGANPSAADRESVSDFAIAGPEGCSTTQYYFFH